MSAGSIQPIDLPKTYQPQESLPVGVVKDSPSPATSDAENHTPPATVDVDLLNSESAMASMTIDSHTSPGGVAQIDMDIETTTHLHADITVSADDPMEPSVEPSPSPPEQPMFFVDTAGDQSLAFKGPRSGPAPRAPSPARSTSSDEVVLFRGRAGVTVRDDPAPVEPAPAPKPASKSASKAASRSASKA